MNAKIARSFAVFSTIVFTCSLAPKLRAQDTLPPLIFLHGFNDNANRWYDAINVLKYNRGYQNTDAFNLNTTNTGISAQGVYVSGQIANLPSSFHNPILIGHSMGGLVAREASTLTPVTAILTVGSPHYGHPALHFSTSASFWYFLGTVSWDVGIVIDKLNHCGETRTGPDGDVEGPCYSVWDFAYYVGWFFELVEIAKAKFFPGPAVDDLRPGSSYLQTLNGSTHVNAETGLERIAVIARLDPSEQFASVWRAVGLDHSESIYWANFAAAVGAATVFEGLDIMIANGLSDPWRSERLAGGAAVVNTGIFVFGLSEWWNNIVGGWPNDGFVNGGVQEFPNSTIRYLTGYSHLEEPSAIELINFIDDLGLSHKR